MPRPLTKSPALTIRVDLDTWNRLLAQCEATGRQPREVAQDLITAALAAPPASSRPRASRGRRITRTPHVEAP